MTHSGPFSIMIYFDNGAVLAMPGTEAELRRIGLAWEEAWLASVHRIVSGMAQSPAGPWVWSFWTGNVVLIHTAVGAPGNVNSGDPRAAAVPPGMNPLGYQQR